MCGFFIIDFTKFKHIRSSINVSARYQLKVLTKPAMDAEKRQLLSGIYTSDALLSQHN